MRLQVGSLASLSGLRTHSCHELECRLQTQLGSGIAGAVVEAAAGAPVRPLVWEPPYAVGAALKDKRQQNKVVALSRLNVSYLWHAS